MHRRIYISLLFLISLSTCQSTSHHSSAQSLAQSDSTENASIPNFHSMGTVNGLNNIYRSASPVRSLVTHADATPDNASVMAKAKLRMDALAQDGIKTIISLEEPESGDDDPIENLSEFEEASGLNTPVERSVAVEMAAAAADDIKFVSHPIANSGHHSLQDMTDQEVLNYLNDVTADILQYAALGGVDFHCAEGHDRTGLVAAFIRIKYQHMSVDDAINEMRTYGHAWQHFSPAHSTSSWHEIHLRHIAHMLHLD